MNKKIMPSLVLALITVAPVFAEHLPIKAQTQLPVRYRYEGEEEQLMDKMKGIVLVGSSDKILGTGALEKVEGLQAIGLHVPGGLKELDQKLKSLYLEKPLDRDKVFEIKDVIAAHYKEYHQPFITIEVPKQDITAGVLQLIVLESKLGNIEVKGNRWSKAKRLKSYVQFKPGQYIRENVLIKDLDFMNRNTFRRVDLIYSPGVKPQTTDVTLYVEDRRPIRVYAGADDTGIETIHRQRWYAGFNWGNAFGLDHILSYQYTTASAFNRFQGHTAQYLALLSWRHLLNLYGGYSSIHADLPFPGMSNHGSSWQSSGRYVIPLNPDRYLRHEIAIGADYKRTNNTVEFSEQFLRISNPVSLFQVVGKYGGNYERDSFRIDFDGEIFCSPGKWLSHQSNSAYQTLRPGAKNTWVYIRGLLNYHQSLPYGCWWVTEFRGQLSGVNLIPSEQLGLGGYNTVRGYEERQVNKDSGLILNAEIRSPAIKLFIRKRVPRKIKDGLQFIAFIDYGYGRNHQPLPTEPKQEYLLGAGPGVRYTLDDYLSVRFDWGFKLHKKEQYKGGDSMVHFAVTMSY